VQVIGAIIGAGVLLVIASGQPGFNVSAGFARSPSGWGSL